MFVLIVIIVHAEYMHCISAEYMHCIVIIVHTEYMHCISAEYMHCISAEYMHCIITMLCRCIFHKEDCAHFKVLIQGVGLIISILYVDNCERPLTIAPPMLVLQTLRWHPL